jgi:hypothetical protein
MTGHMMEIVRFRTAPGSEAAAVASAAAALEPWLRGQPGFVARRLCLGDDGTWTDVVEWRDLAAAQAAAAEIMAVPAAGAFMALIVPGTVDMVHAAIHLSQ